MSAAAPEVVVQGRGDSKQGSEEYETIFGHSFGLGDVDLGSPTSHIQQQEEESIFLQRLKFAIQPQANSHDELVKKLEIIIKAPTEDERLNCIINVFDAIYKNAVINAFVSGANIKYQRAITEYKEKGKIEREVSDFEIFDTPTLHEIEKKSIKDTEECSSDEIITPPSSQTRDSLIFVVYRDCIEKISVKLFGDLLDVFFRNPSLLSILKSAQFLNYNAVDFTAVESSFRGFYEDQCVSFVSQKAKLAEIAIDKIRDALMSRFNDSKYTKIIGDIIIDTPKKLKSDEEDNNNVGALDEMSIVFKNYVIKGVVQALQVEQEESKKKAQEENIESVESKKVQAKNKHKSKFLIDKQAIFCNLISCKIEYFSDSLVQTKGHYSFCVDSNKHGETKSADEREAILSNQEPYMLLGIKIPRHGKIYYLLQHKDGTAAFFKDLPSIATQNMEGSIQSAVLRFLRLFPDKLISAGPYIIYVEIGAFFYAIGVSSYDILFVEQQKKGRGRLNENLCINFLYSIPGGIFYFNALMSFMINVDLKIYPDHFNVSNAYFLTRVAAPSTLLTLSYLVWKMIPLLKKEQIFRRGTDQEYLRKFLDVFFDAGFYGGVLSFFGQTCTINRSVHYLLSILGIVPALLKNLTSYKEIISAIMNILSAVDFIAYTIMNPKILDVDKNPIEPDWHAILRAVLIATLALYSLGLSMAKYKIFVERYVRPEDRALVLLAREVFSRTRNSYQQGILVDKATYNRLLKHVKAGRDVEQALFDQGIITTREGSRQQPLLLSEEGRAAVAPRRPAVSSSGVADTQRLARPEAPRDNGYPPVDNTVVPIVLPVSATSASSPAVVQASRRSFCDRCVIS